MCRLVRPEIDGWRHAFGHDPVVRLPPRSRPTPRPVGRPNGSPHRLAPPPEHAAHATGRHRARAPLARTSRERRHTAALTCLAPARRFWRGEYPGDGRRCGERPGHNLTSEDPTEV